MIDRCLPELLIDVFDIALLFDVMCAQLPAGTGSERDSERNYGYYSAQNQNDNQDDENISQPG